MKRKNKGKGWRNEPVRHGLAGQGIKTTAKGRRNEIHHDEDIARRWECYDKLEEMTEKTRKELKELFWAVLNVRKNKKLLRPYVRSAREAIDEWCDVASSGGRFGLNSEYNKAMDALDEIEKQYIENDKDIDAIESWQKVQTQFEKLAAEVYHIWAWG